MLGFRLAAQKPPERDSGSRTAVVMRFDHVYEVDPALMTEHMPQQDIPPGTRYRIVDSRWEHLAWMHDHFADSVLSGGGAPEGDRGGGVMRTPTGEACLAPTEAGGVPPGAWRGPACPPRAGSGGGR